jgi:putative membrane protein
MLWVKAFHVVAVIAWMAALLYLPRLLVYHSGAAVGSEMSETFKVMEGRLLKAIAVPAMAAVWLSGGTLVWLTEAWREEWFYAKLVLVVLLSAYHGLLSRWVRDFARDENRRAARFYRLMNEVPTLFMILIVILVIVRPF